MEAHAQKNNVNLYEDAASFIAEADAFIQPETHRALKGALEEMGNRGRTYIHDATAKKDEISIGGTLISWDVAFDIAHDHPDA